MKSTFSSLPCISRIVTVILTLLIAINFQIVPFALADTSSLGVAALESEVVLVKLKPHAARELTIPQNSDNTIQDFTSLLPNSPQVRNILFKYKARSIRPSLSSFSITSTDRDGTPRRRLQRADVLSQQLISRCTKQCNNARITETVAKLENTLRIEFPKGTPMNEVVAALSSATAEVQWAQINAIAQGSFTPDDPYFFSMGSFGPGYESYDDLWALKANRVNAELAWDTTLGEGVTVAVVDSGVDYNHLDLRDNMWFNPGEVPNNGIDDDKNGYVDDVRGWDSLDNDNDPIDDHGHGTHCSGTVAARGNNGYGIIGLAPLSRIMPLRFLGPSNYGYVSDAGELIVYAAQNGAKAISNSWSAGEGFYDPDLEAKIQLADALGGLVVFAAGNDFSDMTYYFPQNMPEVMAIAATDSFDQPSLYSNYGELISVAAPGSDILSLRAGGTFNKGIDVGTGFRVFNGTSMATPHVAALAALVKSIAPELDNSSVRSVIEKHAAPIPLWELFGTKRIDAGATISAIAPSGPRIALTTITPKDNQIKIFGVHSSLSGQPYQLLMRATSEGKWIEIGSGVLELLNAGQEQLLGSLNVANFNDDNYLFKIITNDSKRELSNERAYLFKRTSIISLEDEKKSWRPTYFGATTYNVRVDILGADNFSLAIAPAESEEWSDSAISYTLPHERHTFLSNEIAASVNFASISSGIYRLRLRTYHRQEMQESILPFVIDPAKWLSIIPTGLTGHKPLVADLDGDGISEIVFKSISNIQNKLAIVRENGAVDLADAPVAGGTKGILAAKNVDGLPGDEIFVMQSSTNTLHLLKLNAGAFSEVAGWPVTLAFSNSLTGSFDRPSSPFFSDLDSDGSDEIIFMFYKNPAQYYISALKSDGTPFNSSFPLAIDHADKTEPGINIDLAAIDLNHDGIKELIVGTRQSNTAVTPYLRAYSIDGSEYIQDNWPIDLRSISTIPDSPGQNYLPIDIHLGDILGTPDPEIVIQNTLNEITVLNLHGDVMPGWPYAGNISLVSKSVGLGDLNGDQKLEVVNTSGKVLSVLNWQGENLPGFPLMADKIFPDTITSINGITIGDIDGDARPEILVRQYTATPGEFGYDYFTGIAAFKYDGSFLQTFATYGNFPADGRGESPVITDIDSDGMIDLIAAVDLYLQEKIQILRWQLDVPYAQCSQPYPMYKVTPSRSRQSVIAPMCIPTSFDVDPKGYEDLIIWNQALD